MIRLLYTLVLLLLTPLAFLRLWRRGRLNPGYRLRWRERLGFCADLPGRQRLWVHAVSVGETLAAAPLIRAWRAAHPDWAVLVTTTTPTGSAQVARLFGDSVEHCYLPFDLPGATRRFLQRSRPTLAIVMETEIWPNLYARCEQAGVPLLLANARLSDRSFRAYRRLRALAGPALRRVALIAARGPEDAQRFVALGASVEKVEALGNLKFDIEPSEQTLATGRAWRDWLGAQRPVWIAASTHPGEDEPVLAAHQALLARHPGALLLLAPRHPERADAVLALVESAGLGGLRRSGLPAVGQAPGQPMAAAASVLVIDTLGELMGFYAASDVAYVGGSLVASGGHNPIEPLVLGLPVVSGREVFNFREVYAELDQMDAVALVGSGQELAAQLCDVFSGWPALRQLPAALPGWLRANQGSTARLLQRAEALGANHAAQDKSR